MIKELSILTLETDKEINHGETRKTTSFDYMLIQLATRTASSV